MWRIVDDAIAYVVVGLEEPAGWTLQDWLNEQAWSQFTHLRID